MSPIHMLVLFAIQAPEPLPPTDPRWQLEGPAGGVQITTIDGRPAFQIGTGRALARTVVIEDGTVDLEVRLSGLRSFVYVQFRMASDRDHEEFYLRPQKTNLPDAVQYAPVYRGESAWQLYHGPGATAAVNLPADRWLPVRVAVAGDRAALYVGDTVTPALVVPHLAAGHGRGYFALRGFVPPGSSAPYAALFRDVRVTRRPVRLPDAPATPAPAPGVIGSWRVSQPFQGGPGPIQMLSDSILGGAWRTVSAAPSGLLTLSGTVARPAPGRATVLARLLIVAPRAGVYPLRLGFSDEVTVFVARRPLFAANAAYSHDQPRQDGVIHLDQATAYLPLETGPNEVILAVSDVFGGWGLMAQLDPALGLRLAREP